MASRIQGIAVEIGGDTTKLSKALEGVNKSIKGTQSGLKDVNKLLKLDPSNTELVVQKQKMLKDAIEATKEKLATLKTAAQQANEQLANGEITQQQYDALQREIAETEQNLKSLQEQAATTNATLAKIDEAGEKLQNLGSSVENVGKKFLPVTAAVTGLGTAAVKTAADFDAEMSKVSAISGATGADFDKLRAKAREMGAKTKFSATEAASAMEYMAMAGWRTEDMLSGIEGIMNLAAASGEDLATTSDIVTDALTAFGLSASDSGHFADILAAASSNANTNVSMMGETFKYCAPIAGALGFSAEDTAEAIGLMANSGIKASQAGTSLRSIMNNLAGDVTFVGKNIGEVTIATSNADGSMRSLNDILADCRVAFAGLSESEKAANAEALVGKNAMSGFLALMNAGEGDINKLRGAIEGCDGASERMAETMQDNLSGQLTILKSQLEELAISFADILMPTIRKIVSAVQQFVDKLNSMDDSTREVIIRVALLAAAIGPLLIVLGKTISTVGTAMRGFSSLAKGVRLLITHVGGASGAFGKLGAVLGGLSGPVVAVVAVIGTLVAAFLDLWNTNEEFRTAITGIWNDIVSKVKAFCDQLTQRINALGFDFKDITQVLQSIWNGFCQLLAPLFEGAFQNISTILGVVLDSMVGLLDVFSNIFSGNWRGAWESAKSIFSGIWQGIRSILSVTLTTLRNTLDVFLGFFGTSWQSVWSGIQQFFVSIWSGISGFFSDTASSIYSVAISVFTGISGFFTSILTSIQTTFRTTWTAISQSVSSALTVIHDTVVRVWMAISTVISSVMTSICETILQVWSGIYTTIQPLLEAFQYLFKTIWQAIQILVGAALTEIHSKIVSIWNSIVAFVTPLLSGLQSVFSAAWTDIQLAISTVLTAIRTSVTSIWNVQKAVSGNTEDDIVTPSHWDCMEGRQLSIFYDCLSRHDGKENLYVFAKGTNAPTLTRNEYCMNYTPTTESSDFSLTVRRLDENDCHIVSSKAVQVKVHHKLKNKLTKNVCICGDSLVDNGHVATEVYRLLAEDGDCVIHQLGTRGPDGGKHEGRGSWTFARYLADSDYAGKTNAFWDKLKSRLDFQKYCETNGYEGIDYFLIALGTNDVSQGSTLYRTEAEVQKFVDQAKQFIDALLDKETGFPNCKVGIGLCGPGSDYSYQCGASMGIFHMSINTLNLALIKAFDAGKYHKNVTCFAHGLRTDRRLAFPYADKPVTNRFTETSRTLTNSIHPSARGYQAWADGYYCQIRAWLTEDSK